MAQTFLIFNFGGDEEAAQQARHRIDGWRQGFRLDKKLQLKFDRNDHEAAPSSKAAGKGRKTDASPGSGPEEGKSAGAKTAATSDIRLIVRLDFSEHEKLSHHRWVERIPSEDLFKGATPKIVRSGDPEFAATAEHFESLD